MLFQPRGRERERERERESRYEVPSASFTSFHLLLFAF
jgi:hypothetical protein